MAIELLNKTGVINTDAAYPRGKQVDDNGSGNGYVVDVASEGDYHQFFAKMLGDWGGTINNLPENDTNGYQYNEAFDMLTGRMPWVDDGLPTVSGGLTFSGGAVRYNSYRMVGSTLYWQLTIAGGTIAGAPTSLQVDLPSVITTQLMANNTGFQLGCYVNVAAEQVLLIKTRTTTNSVLLTLPNGAAFANGSANQSISFSLVIPLI